VGSIQLHLVKEKKEFGCFITNGKLNFFFFLLLFKSGTLADAVGLPHHGLQYIPGATVPSPQEASNGFRTLMPLLCSMENAMSRFDFKK
jgi:hypothetical protein